MTPEDFKKCGLQKLTNTELESLNDWMVSTMAGGVAKATDGGNPLATRGADTDDEIALYDGQGNAVAYIATSDDSTVYTWAGKPVAYLDADNIYGFNGKHLGWFQDGKLFDHQGRIAGTTTNAATIPLKAAPFKGFKQFQPFKAFEEFAPLQPIFGFSQSQIPLALLLSQGAK